MPGRAVPIGERAARYASTLPARPAEERRGMQRSAVKMPIRQRARSEASATDFVPSRTIVLVGLMGAGKTNIGRRLAARLNLPFFDSDSEIEAAAGETIEEIFRNRGEAVFRDGERRVIARLLGQPIHVLATGGGAFMDATTRAVIARHGVSVWLRADVETLLARVSRRSNRPLLKQGNPRAVLTELIERRHPIYAEADITIDSDDAPADLTAARTIDALAACPRALTPPDPETGP
jgi:shikimate kinase